MCSWLKTSFLSLRKADCPLWYGGASSHQLKDLTEQRLTSPEQEGSLIGDGFKLELQHWLFPGSLGCQPTLQILGFPASIIMQISWKLLVVSDSLRPHGLYSPWNSPGQNTGMGILSLLQEILPIQGSNPGLLHCSRILCQLSPKGSPRILG